jgi:AraC-like DNA-binding protein
VRSISRAIRLAAYNTIQKEKRSGCRKSVLQQLLPFQEGSMYDTPIQPVQSTPPITPSTALVRPTPAFTDAEMIIAHLIHRGVLRPDSLATRHVRTIFTAPPEALRVNRIARRIYASRRTLGRHLRAAGLPSPIDWVALARAVYAHRTILRGGPIRLAASSAGYPDEFTMSNAVRRILGMRPTQLRGMTWKALLDLWIARQRERGSLSGPRKPTPPSCPTCGMLRAS